jgi:hypothetical protein
MTKSDDESFRALIEANVRGWKGYLRRRRRFSAEFKEVALEAIKGHETVAERPSTELHPT